MMRKITLVGIVSVFFILTGFINDNPADNFRKDISLINKSYNSFSNLSMAIKVKQSSGSNILSSEMGTWKRKQEKEYSKFGSLETVKDGKLYLIVDNDQNVITISKSLKRSFSMTPNQALDSFCKEAQEVTKLEDRRGQTGYNISFHNGLVSNLRLYFNSKSYFISSMVFEYMDGEDRLWSEINYSDISTSLIPDSYFDSSKYVRIVGKSYFPTTKYSGYQILNY